MEPRELSEARADIRLLAREMVRFDRFIAAAEERGHHDQVVELSDQRERAQQRRSALMREIWQP